MTEWPQWSKSFGLVENEHKVAVVSRHQPWAEELLTLGFEVGQIKSHARVLGVDFHSKRHFGQTPAREVRLTHGLSVASRLQRANSAPPMADSCDL